MNGQHARRSPAGGVVPAGQGLALTAGATRPTVKVGPHNGSRLLGLIESDVLPGQGFPAHVHDEYEEVFYVLSGEIQYLLDRDWTSAPAGSTVFVPAGRAHAFRNVGDETARHLAITSPAEAITMIEDAVRSRPHELGEVLARYRSRLADQR